MKLITDNGRIIATVLDSYEGEAMQAPADFDITRMAEYRVGADGTLTLTLVPPTATVPPRAITYWAFRKRFTHTERVGLELAGLDDPIADAAQRQLAASVRVYLADAAAAAWIDLDDEDTRTGVQALEAAELIAQGRSAQILDSPVQELERPPA